MNARELQVHPERDGRQGTMIAGANKSVKK